ncbi:probable phosphorylase b kinase regulatory subunit alpha [Diaphorina citri]|uniref:Phosphorylase b kinase regulatory subunit n=1 Tax=Diaphorina citri TaxID=121845 RepID=A0A1S3DMR0_DIACI|nr:probable phosphorylase b kinase regulatory subunit alpha [Diaphorina citri]
MGNDVALLANNLISDLAFLSNNWRHVLGRPTYTIIASNDILDHEKIPLAMITTMKKLKSGYINGTRYVDYNNQNNSVPYIIHPY